MKNKCITKNKKNEQLKNLKNKSKFNEQKAKQKIHKNYDQQTNDNQKTPQWILSKLNFNFHTFVIHI